MFRHQHGRSASPRPPTGRGDKPESSQPGIRHAWIARKRKTPPAQGIAGGVSWMLSGTAGSRNSFHGIKRTSIAFPVSADRFNRRLRCPHHSPVAAPQRRASTTGPENRANSIPRRRTPHSSRRTAWAQLYATATNSFSSHVERSCRRTGGGRHAMSRPPSPRSDCYSKLPCHPRAPPPTQPVTPQKSPRW